MREYSLGLYEKAMPDSLGWEEKLTLAGQIGYDFVELSIDESPERLSRLDWTEAERQSLLAAMAKTGVKIRSMCLSGHRKYPIGSEDGATRRRGMEIMEKAIHLADDLGIRTVQLAGYDVYYGKSTAGSKELFCRNLQDAVNMASSAGILLGFETMETEFMNTVWKAMYYVTGVSSPYLGVYPDVGNLTNAALSSGGDVSGDLMSGRGHIVAVHLKPTKPGLFRNVSFDDPDQHVDFEAAIGISWRLGVRRFVTELWHMNSPRWRENIGTAYSCVTKILDKKAAERRKEHV